MHPDSHCMFAAEQAMNAAPSREPAGATVTSGQDIGRAGASASQLSPDKAAPTASTPAPQQDKAEPAAEPSSGIEHSESPESKTAHDADSLPLEEQRPSPSVQHARQPASVAGFQFNGSQPFS